MYPDGELNRLAGVKLNLRRGILVRRGECIVAAEQLAEPIGKLDRAVAQWRRISPATKLAALPLAFVFKRALFPRAKIIGTVLKWGPVAYKVLRGFKAARSR